MAAKRLAELRAQLQNTEQLIDGKACVYITGSFGRGEASAWSDLDLFIVGRNQTNAAEKIDKLFDAYGCFLETTGKDEEILIGEFLDEQKRKEFKASANSFGDLVFAILSALGQDNALFRLLVV